MGANISAGGKIHFADYQEFVKWRIPNIQRSYDRFRELKTKRGKDGDLTMSRNEFWETFTDYDTIVDGQFLTLPVELYSLFDPEGQNQLYALEIFVVLALFCSAEDLHEKVRWCFSLFDFDESNTISRPEMVMMTRCLSRGLQSIGSMSTCPSYAELEKLSDETFQELDTDHNNELSLAEFTKWAMANHQVETFLAYVLESKTGLETLDEGINVRGKRSLRGSRAAKNRDGSSVRHRNLNTPKTTSKMTRTKMMSHVTSKKTVHELSLLSGLSIGDVKALGEEFAKYAWENKGLLTSVHFARILERRFKDLKDRSIIHRLFEVFDVEHRDGVNFHDLVIGLARVTAGTAVEKLDLLFTMLDLDNSGKIDASELINGLSHAHEALQAEAQFCLQILHSLDGDHNGDISCVEFVKALSTNAGLMGAFSRKIPKFLESQLLMLQMEQGNRSLTFKSLKQFWLIRRAESRWDHPQNHCVGKGEFRQLMREAFDCTEKGLDFLEGIFDMTAKQSSEFEEPMVEIRQALNGVAQTMRATPEENAEFIFDLYDFDGSGSIDPVELLQMVLEAHADFEVASDNLLEIVRQFDTSGDHLIDHEEFLSAFKEHPHMMDLFGHLFEATHSPVDFSELNQNNSQKKLGKNALEVKKENDKMKRKLGLSHARD